MSEPFHHKHPYLTVLILLIMLLIVTDFFTDLFGRDDHRHAHHGPGYHYGYHHGQSMGHDWHHGGPVHPQAPRNHFSFGMDMPHWMVPMLHEKGWVSPSPMESGFAPHTGPEIAFTCLDDLQNWAESRLIMGQGADGGTAVSEADWQAFVEAEIRPRLPLGFTVLDAAGHWGDGAGGFFPEPAKVLVLLHDGSGRDTVTAIGAAYLETFDRNFVLRADSPACVRFNRG